MPLNEFINQVADGTIDPLVYEEFADAIKDSEQSYYEILCKEINILESKYLCIQLGVKYMEVVENISKEAYEEMRNQLKKILPIRDNDSLQVILGRSVRLVTELEEKKAELEKIKPTSEGEVADRKYFTHVIIQLTKFYKFQIDKFKTSVAEFAEMIIDMRETNKAIEMQLNKHARE